MKSVVIKTLEDFEKITNDTSEIEFVEYNNFFSFADDCILPAISFTKMYVDVEVIPRSIEKLGLFDCDVNIKKLNIFTKLKYLEITNRKVDVSEIISVSNLEKLSLNFCEIINVELVEKFSNLKEISLIETNIDEFRFLNNISSLEKVIIDDDNYEKNRDFFYELESRGIFVCDMIGEMLNEV